MKKIIFVALAIICMAACSSNKTAVIESDTVDSVEMVDTICVDTVEYDSVL